MDLERVIPTHELDMRLSRLQARLAAAGDAEAVFIFQPADLFYWSGTVQDAWLVIPREGPALLLVRRSLERAQAESGLSRILPLGGLRGVPGLLASQGLGSLRRVGLEFERPAGRTIRRPGSPFPADAVCGRLPDAAGDPDDQIRL